MSNKPFISLWGPSNRPHLWMWFYNNLVSNSIPFEVIWVGDVRPDFEMPQNMRFIYSTVKISQLAQIAVKYSIGETLCHIADDMEIYPGCLDKLAETYIAANDYKCMVWPQWGPGEYIETAETTGLIPLGIGALMSRKLFDEIGSFDRRYYCNTFEEDLQYRARSKQFGGWYVQLPLEHKSSYMWERKDLILGGMLAGAYYKWNGQADNVLLASQWHAPDGTLKSESTTPLEPFEDNYTLLTISQGNANDWDAMHDPNRIVVESPSEQIMNAKRKQRIIHIGGTGLFGNAPRSIG